MICEPMLLLCDCYRPFQLLLFSVFFPNPWRLNVWKRYICEITKIDPSKILWSNLIKLFIIVLFKIKVQQTKYSCCFTRFEGEQQFLSACPNQCGSESSSLIRQEETLQFCWTPRLSSTASQSPSQQPHRMESQDYLI